MNDDRDRVLGDREAHEVGDREAWEAPQLEILGSVYELTTAGGGFSTDQPGTGSN